MHASLAHYRVHEAVVYQDAAASAAGIGALDPKPEAKLVWEALNDGTHRVNRVAVMIALGHHEHAGVIAAEKARAEQEAADRAATARAEAEENARLDAMTAVAVGDATVEEARTIRSAIHGALEDHETDGTPRRIDGSRSKGLILLKRGTDPTAVGFCVPLGNDRHAPLGAAINVRWQESPDESDVSGVFHCARPGRAVNAKTAGQRNVARARRELAAKAAARALAATLTEEIAEHIGLPAGSTTVRPLGKWNGGGAGHYGTTHHVTADGRYATRTTDYDFPTRIHISAGPVAANVIGAGLGIDPETIPKPTADEAAKAAPGPEQA